MMMMMMNTSFCFYLLSILDTYVIDTLIKYSNVFAKQQLKIRMVVHGQLVEPAVSLNDLYDVFLLDIVRDTRQNLWTMIYLSQ